MELKCSCGSNNIFLLNKNIDIGNIDDVEHKIIIYELKCNDCGKIFKEEDEVINVY